MPSYTSSLPGIVAGFISLACTLLTNLSSHSPAQTSRMSTATRTPSYQQTLHFNIYTFTVETPDTGLVRMASIKVWRGQLLLTNFRIPIDGAITATNVADLDNNRFPELYIFSQSGGSGSFGRVYGWQFLPERKAGITPINWQLPPDRGYMGHDSLWLDYDALCRQFPRYQPGDTNASPTGGTAMMRYQLSAAGPGFVLKEL